jgi:hypothetical protein
VKLRDNEIQMNQVNYLGTFWVDGKVPPRMQAGQVVLCVANSKSRSSPSSLVLMSFLVSNRGQIWSRVLHRTIPVVDWEEVESEKLALDDVNDDWGPSLDPGKESCALGISC